MIQFTYELHCKASRTSAMSSRLEAGAVMRFTYELHCKESRTSAMSSRLDWRRVQSCGSLTSCIPKQAERQPCRLDCRRVRSCGSLTSCIAKRAERQPCHLHPTAGRCGNAVPLPATVQSEPKVSHVVSTGSGCGHAVHLLAALQSEPNVSHVISTRLEACAVMRFTYSLHSKASGKSAMSSRLDWRPVRSCGSLTSCIAKRAERQPCRLDRLEAGVVMRFTYHLHCKASRTSAMSSRLDWRRVRSCGSLTGCIAKRAERQPCRLDSTGGGCGQAVHLPSALHREPNVSNVVSTRLKRVRSCGSLTSCIAKRAESQPCQLDSTGGGCGHAVHLLPALQSEPNVSRVVST